jgi:carboxyl-terminal processing protease
MTHLPVSATRRVFPARRPLLSVLIWTLAASALISPVWADPTAPSASDRQVAKTVMLLLQREHLSRHPLDKEISQRCFKLFLKELDPLKLYFYQSDVDAFAKYQDQLADLARKGDVSFAYMVFKTFLQRVDERVRTAEEMLAAPHDFSVDEEMVVDKDKANYPRDPAEAREMWRKRVKYDLLVMKADKTEGTEAVEKLKRRYEKNLRMRWHQTDGEELLERYLTAMTSSLDPHTSYMSPSTLENFRIAMSLELEGIGAALQSIDGYTVVNDLISGGAAEKQGELKVEDKIIGVGQGESGPIEDTVDEKLSEVVKKVRGKEGTVVRLKVTRVGTPEPKTIKITRAKIELKDSEASEKVFEVGHKPDGTPYKVGVIDLPSFYMDMDGARRGLPDYRSTTADVKKILGTFNSSGVDAVVLDLRRNGGGSLTEAINLTGLFIKEGPVVQVKDAEGHVLPYYDLDSGIFWSGPLVVLTSKFSASASEILAGAIQDYGRGLIIGDHSTHGKGTVQSLLDLGQQLFGPNATAMGALKITMQQFYRPLGESTQKRGVEADIELPSLTTHLDVGEADLDYPVAFDKIDPLNFKRFGYANGTIRDQLNRLSEERRGGVEKFQKLAKDITRYEEQKARKAVNLNEEKFLKDRAELNADKEEEKKIDELNNSKHKGIKRDFYLDEVLALVVDYLGSLHAVAKAR